MPGLGRQDISRLDGLFLSYSFGQWLFVKGAIEAACVLHAGASSRRARCSWP
jgi:hypothetical protein